jgi:hypothetical protein
MKLMYMDECKSTDTDVVSLTAIVVDESSYREYRENIYRTLSRWIVPCENTFACVPEIHGSRFLPGAESDKIRIETAVEIFAAVRKSAARIYRCGYYRDPNLPAGMRSDASLLQLAFLSIQMLTTHEREGTLILPIMDGVDPNIAKTFGESNHAMLGYMSCGLSESAVSIAHMHNIIDPVVSDSRYSVCSQASDLVSYGLHCKEWIRLELKESLYKKQLSDAIDTLSDSIASNETIRFKIE